MFVDKEELNEVYTKYHDSINMSYNEFKDWSKTECSRKASLDRSPITRNLELLKTNNKQVMQTWVKK